MSDVGIGTIIAEIDNLLDAVESEEIKSRLMTINEELDAARSAALDASSRLTDAIQNITEAQENARAAKEHLRAATSNDAGGGVSE